MKRIVIIIAALLFAIMPVQIYAQSNSKQKTDSVTALLKNYINTQNNQALYTLTSKKYQAVINAKDFADFFNAQIFTSGQITASSFLGFDKNTAHYKLTFEKELLQLSVILDEQGKLDYLVFEPFVARKTDLVATSNPLKTYLEKRIDSAIRVYIQQPNTVGLSVGIINKGNISVYAYGETVKGNKQLPDANTLFEIGSITKTFTSTTLLAHYVLQGKIRLSDPITKYLPDSVVANKNLQGVTLMQLSNHTSGLPRLPDNLFSINTDQLDPFKNYDRAQLFAYLKTCKLNSKPGEVYVYSNIAVGLLGVILERISNRSFEQMIQSIICKPLNMKSTVQYLSAENNIRFTKVYNASGVETPAWHIDALAGAGALHSTVTDLLLYTKANMSNGTEMLSKAFALTHQITFAKDAKLGLAWHIIRVDNSEYYFHNGGTYGSSSFLAFNADKDVAVVILSNSAISTDTLGAGLINLIQ